MGPHDSSTVVNDPLPQPSLKFGMNMLEALTKAITGLDKSVSTLTLWYPSLRSSIIELKNSVDALKESTDKAPDKLQVQAEAVISALTVQLEPLRMLGDDGKQLIDLMKSLLSPAGLDKRGPPVPVNVVERKI